MSYHFKDSGYPGEDYLIVTKKGKEEGNLPDGIILLGGLMYCDMDFRNWIREAEQNGYYVYPAKHCNDQPEAYVPAGREEKPLCLPVDTECKPCPVDRNS